MLSKQSHEEKGVDSLVAEFNSSLYMTIHHTDEDPVDLTLRG
jgi:hypothetical protein